MRFAPRYGIALTVAALSIGVAACGSDSGSDSGGGSSAKSGSNTATPREGVTKDAIKYGMIYDQTGPQTVSQTPWAHGFLTQINKANDAGGINGRKIEILDEDDKGEVPTGIAAYKKLVSQTPVLGISGINGSSIQEAALKSIEKDNMPLVGPQSTVKGGLVPLHKSIFYIVPPYSDQADVIMDYMQKRTGKAQPKVAIFRLTASSGIEVGQLITDRVKKAGGQIVADQEMDVTATSADAQAQKIVSAKPDWILVHSAPTQAVALLKAMQKLNAKIPLISTFAAGGPPVYQAMPKEYGDLYQYTAPTTPADVDVPGTKQLVADATKYGYTDEAGNSSFVIGYLSGMTVVDALKKAGGDLNRETFIKALDGIKNLDTGGISEPITYGDTDHAGLSGTRPYKFNYDTKKFEAVGDFADYDGAITNEYSSH
ncbi:ABC transporter substrate-binding protein [Solirubrobacter soli]|uniref:ABC transporter substrate-binding protein n=1 Tax=Solirubrobacter soli TaxID=363832 RepID=UPI00040CE821|nr:ABC transporter substrate-binding protein [Solirubrobacter soli]